MCFRGTADVIFVLHSTCLCTQLPVTGSQHMVRVVGEVREPLFSRGLQSESICYVSPSVGSLSHTQKHHPLQSVVNG